VLIDAVAHDDPRSTQAEEILASEAGEVEQIVPAIHSQHQ
jgi:hypothetical protein